MHTHVWIKKNNISHYTTTWDDGIIHLTFLIVLCHLRVKFCINYEKLSSTSSEKNLLVEFFNPLMVSFHCTLNQ